jgi:hypothetical protein
MLEIDREVASLALVIPSLHPAVRAQGTIGQVELCRTASVNDAERTAGSLSRADPRAVDIWRELVVPVCKA